MEIIRPACPARGGEPLRVLLAAADSQYIHSALAPWCLLAGLREYCGAPFEALLAEGSVNEPVERFAKLLAAERPALAGFSCYIWNVEYCLRAAALLKKALPDCLIVFGGPEVSYRAGDFLRENAACDFVLAGEGELPIARLTEAAAGLLAFSAVPGLSRRAGGEIVAGEPYITRELPPSPYCPEYFAALSGRFAYLETSRGCPFSCAFCLSGREGGVRFYPLDRVKRELAALAVSGARAVKLVDRTFNAGRERAREIFAFIIENYGGAIPRGVRFHFEIGGDLLDGATLALLAGAPRGSMQLEIGLQSFDPRALAAVCRKTDTELLTKNIAAVLAPRNIHVHIDLIAGLPYEDAAGFAQSFRAAFALRPDMLQLGFLKLLYGAPMRERPLDYPCAFSPRPPYEVISTPWLTPAELALFHGTDAALGRVYNSGRFRRTLEYALSLPGADCWSFFTELGQSMAGRAPLSLDALTELVFAHISSMPGADPALLTDMLSLDRLATDPSGALPPSLRVRDPRIKRARLALDADPATRRPPNVRRGFVWLATEGRAAYADYISPDPVTGEYPLLRAPAP